MRICYSCGRLLSAKSVSSTRRLSSLRGIWSPNAYPSFLLAHLYQFFGVLLGCSQYGHMGFPAYGGEASMYEVHKSVPTPTLHSSFPKTPRLNPLSKIYGSRPLPNGLLHPTGRPGRYFLRSHHWRRHRRRHGSHQALRLPLQSPHHGCQGPRSAIAVYVRWPVLPSWSHVPVRPRGQQWDCPHAHERDDELDELDDALCLRASRVSHADSFQRWCGSDRRHDFRGLGCWVGLPSIISCITIGEGSRDSRRAIHPTSRRYVMGPCMEIANRSCLTDWLSSCSFECSAGGPWLAETQHLENISTH